MNFGPRSASRSIKMAALGVSLSLFSTAAIVAMAQQRPNEFHGVLNDAAVSDSGTGSTVRFAEVSPVNDARIATSSLVSSTSEKLTVAGAPGHHRVPMVTDWSTKHVVFAKPRTEKDAARLEYNTRYRMQTYRRNAPMLRKLADSKVDSSDLLERFRNRVRDPHPLPAKANPIHRDWSINLNGNGITAPTPTVGKSQFPAKFSFDINAPLTAGSCTTDFVVYNTNTNLLVGFDNLYSGTSTPTAGLCGDAGPTVMFAYDVTTNSGITSTSVTLSEDGTQIAVVENSVSGGVLHIVKWFAGDGAIGSPVVLRTTNDVTGNVAAWDSAACGGTHSCMWDVPFANDFVYDPAIPGLVRQTATDTNSAPYYDYDTDFLYVGTDSANIHQFANVFNGGSVVPTAVGPSETTTGNGLVGWPLFMNTTANPPPALTGPIEDAYSGRIFVADSYGDLDHVETFSGDCVNQPHGAALYPCLSINNLTTGGNNIPDPPVVDSSLGTVLVFVGGDNLTGNAYVAQAPSTSCICGTSETSTDPTVVFENFGPVNGGGSGTVIHSGDFDNNYYTSDGATPGVAGFMYVCAIDPLGTPTGPPGTGGNTALRQVTFNTDGVINGVSTAYLPVATDSYDECSPVTEVYNPNALGGAADLIFFSVEAHSVACPGAGPVPDGGCLMSLNITADLTTTATNLFSPILNPVVAIAEDGGTSGIVVDNVSPDAQASSIYFTPLGDTVSPGDCTYIGCAVKVTQVGLQ